MTDTNQTAEQAVDILTVQPAQKQTLKERFKDPTRWKKSLSEVGVWFLFGGLLTTMLSMYAPGYPIIVGTNSITPGVYWLDRTAFAYSVEDFVTFDFRPSQDWIQQRYGGPNRVFTKLVKGVAGDTIYADANLRLTVCRAPVYSGGERRCQDLGTPQTQDSLGRPMTPWLPANHQYTLADGELWAYGVNPKSLDSRYYGPVRTSAVTGKAKPIFFWE